VQRFVCLPSARAAAVRRHPLPAPAPHRNSAWRVILVLSVWWCNGSRSRG
jgi:hypothetical protein